MSAQIVDLAEFRTQRLSALAAQASPMCESAPHAEEAPAAPFQFWTGSSGNRYVHSIYNLFECPPVDEANYILVKRHRDGQRTVLSIGRVNHTSGNVNLANIRQRAAEMGANEVHVHLLAGSTGASLEIESDLRKSLVIA